MYIYIYVYINIYAKITADGHNAPLADYEFTKTAVGLVGFGAYAFSKEHTLQYHDIKIEKLLTETRANNKNKTQRRRTLQHTATHCNTLQHTATHCNTMQDSKKTHPATPCNTLPHTVTHCNTLQHTATHCNTMQDSKKTHPATHCHTLPHTATHCNTLQHTATHCNTQQHTATLKEDAPLPICGTGRRTHRFWNACLPEIARTFRGRLRGSAAARAALRCADANSSPATQSALCFWVSRIVRSSLVTSDFFSCCNLSSLSLCRSCSVCNTDYILSV